MSTYNILQGWIGEGQLPVSWQLEQPERRMNCFVEWLNEVTDCESILVMDQTNQAIVSLNADESIKEQVAEENKGWNQLVREDDSILHWSWINVASGPVALALVSSMELDPKFLATIAGMFQAAV